MNYTKQVNEIIQTYENDPIDLLRLGAGADEYTYLQEMQYAYARTLNDVVPILKKKCQVLEIGSLFGVVSRVLKQADFEVTATDIPEFHQSEKLRELYRRNNIPFDSLDLRDGNLSYPSESFDAVIICEVIEHLNFNPLPVLQEINRVLKKNGVLYLAIPNQGWIMNRVKLLFGKSIHPPVQQFFDQLDKSKNHIVSLHWREYTMHETVELLQRTNFTIAKNYFFRENGPQKTTLFSWMRFLLYLIPSFRPSLVILARKKS